MKKKIYFFKFDTSRQDFFLPMIWFNFKRYYELHGKHSDKWEWIPPTPHYIKWTLDEIIQEVISHKADVYAFNSYIWSWNVIKIVAKAVRQAHPNAIIVLGGPHQGTTWTDPLLWFKKYSYFDATCTPTEYGEWFLQDLLDQIADGQLDWSTVRNSYHRKGRGPAPNKKLFEFPSDVISSNLNLAMEYARISEEVGKPLTILYETNRGCPYGCTYCEWGGGINTKVVPNAMENIVDDFSYFPVLGIKSVYITDANFGILKRDGEIAELLATLKSSINDVYIGGLAKTSNDKRRKVLIPLIESGLLRNYQMSIQSVNPEVLKAIDRTDISVEENVALAKELIDQYDIGINVELILGLPGSVLQDFYDECDVVHQVFNKYGGVTRAPFFVLPDSPAASPEYYNKYGLKLVPIGMEGEGGEQEKDQGTQYIAIYDTELISENVVYIPVASNTYSVEDWKEIFFMTDMDMLFSNQHLLKPLLDYLWYHKNITPGQFIKSMFTILRSLDNFYNPVEIYLSDISEGRAGNKDWRGMIVPDIGYQNVFRGLLYLWHVNKKQIFDEIRKKYQYLMDDKLLDCILYIENSTFREDYDIEWTNEYRWDLWEELKDKKQDIIKGQISFITWANPIKWNELGLGFVRTVFTKRSDGSIIQVRRMQGG